MTTPIPLRVLLVEDREADARLLIDALRQAGFAPEWARVDTEPDYVARLDPGLDIVFADYSMPQFDALRALEGLRARGLDIPFIIVSGTIGEELAVTAMQRGAADYLLKDRLGRLGEAVHRVLRERRLLAEKREGEARLALQATALSAAANGIMITDQAGTIRWVNPAFTRITGYGPEEVLGQNPRLLRSGQHAPGLYADLWQTVLAGQVWAGEMVNRRKDGTFYVAEQTITPVRSPGGETSHFVAITQDVTERRRIAGALREQVALATLGADIGLTLTRGDALPEALRQCADSMVRNLGAALARIWTLDEGGTGLELQASAGMYTHVDGPHGRVPVGHLEIGRIALTRQPHLSNDVPDDPLTSDPEWARREGMVAFAGYPLLVEDRLVGVLAMFARQRLSPSTLDAMAAVANEIALGIERKRAERGLRFTQFTIDHLATPVFWASDEGRFFDVNEAACRLTGYTRDELLALHVHDVDRDLTAGGWQGVREELRGRRVLVRESWLRRKDGTEIPISVTSNLLHAEGREYTCTFVQDISERKRVEEARRQSALRFRAIFNQTFEHVSILSADGTILEINQPALDLLGLTQAEVVGRPVWEAPWLDTAETRQRVRAAVAAAAGGRFLREEIIVPDRAGEPRTFDFSLKAVAGETGVVELLIAEARDITDQKKLEEQLRQGQKMEAVGRLAGGVAHDFNNLLTVITGYSTLALTTLPEGDRLRGRLEQIRKAGERAALLTRQLLAFSRRQVLVPTVLDLNALVIDLEKMLGRLIGEDVNLAVRAAPGLWPLKADAGQLQQVIMNLAVNARDAMPEGGRLTIETANIELDEGYAAGHPDARPGLHVRLAVSDSGCGMDAATRARIFEPFFTTKGPERGTGLGLATVYGIVRQSGGHIKVYSEPGDGTTFKVYLPALLGGPAAGSAVELSGTVEGDGETVLLVEDQDDVRALARLILGRARYEVLEAANGEEALRVAERHGGPIDLLITDVVMPAMGGFELARRLRGVRPGIKLLYMSGYTEEAILRQGLIDIDAPLLEKPFTPDGLARKVREALERREAGGTGSG